MFTKSQTFEEIMQTGPVRKSIGNLFPSCWLDRIPPQHYRYTIEQIEKEDRMEWGVPFLSDAFLECASLLMETAQNHNFMFIPLWNTDHADTPSSSIYEQIPEADLNNADGVWLFTGSPRKDNRAFAHTSAAASVPPYPSHAVSKEKLEQSSRLPAVIICPGGGYEMLSSYSEGVQIAQRMERDGGYKAFVLNYRITPNYYPLPQMDLALAIMHVRAFAGKYQINPNRILVIGSSAGGHLCASEAYLHDKLKQLVLEELSKKKVNSDVLKMYENSSARPDGIGLLYPVISFLSNYHEGSFQNLTNQMPGLWEQLSVEQHIRRDYPPVYAFANEDDDCVPADNTSRLERALSQAGIPHLCEIFPTGNHGVGLGYECSCREWSEHMLAFFDKN